VTPPTTAPEPLLEITDLRITYRGRRSRVDALKGVSLSIAPGTVLGLVGESGSGKSTIGNATLGLVPVTSGSIRFNGRDITHVHRRDRKTLARSLQAVFQNPYGSLNPTKTIGATLAEPMQVQRELGRADIGNRVREVLRKVGMPDDAASRYPRAFSGGQRQRIAIARALVLSPKLIICDEPVSALDLSIQAQILNLLCGLKAELGLSMLFISHDLAVVRYVSDSIVVLRNGEVVEQGPAARVYEAPQAEYTRTLLAAAPRHARWARKAPSGPPAGEFRSH
jgi:ABC-type glutathione transport system ATPase component